MLSHLSKLSDLSEIVHGMDNLEWIQKNMNDPDKVEEFLHYMTEGYNCGIAKTKKEVLELRKARYFDFPEYISYWDGKKWKNI